MALDTPACLDALRDAAQHVIRFLGTSQGLLHVAQQEDQFHSGDDPIVADLDTHVEFESRLKKHPSWSTLRVWDVVGEEHIVKQPPTFEAGTRVFVVDPLDGSTAWAMARQAYCVAAMSLLAGVDGKLALECAVIATPVHTFTFVAPSDFRFGPTASRHTHDYLIHSLVPQVPVRNKSLALNGYKARDRRLVGELMRRLHDWDVVTVGGNPFTPYVILGNLTAVLNTRAQCTWDALGFLMCTATDAVVGSVDGTLVSGGAFRALFNKVALEGNVKLIPPMIVAKSETAFRQVARAFEDAVSTVGTPEFDDPWLT